MLCTAKIEISLTLLGSNLTNLFLENSVLSIINSPSFLGKKKGYEGTRNVVLLLVVVCILPMGRDWSILELPGL